MTLAGYARAIERLGLEFGALPRVLSPREWELVAGWHRRGVPLSLLRDCFAESAGRKRGRRLPSVAVIARAVEECWQAVQAGRLAGDVRPTDLALRSARRTWADRIAEEPAGSPLKQALEDGLAKLDAGVGPDAVDEDLDRGLLESVDPELLARVTREIDRDLEPYRGRMLPDGFQATRRRAMVRLLRESLGLGRLDDDRN